MIRSAGKSRWHAVPELPRVTQRRLRPEAAQRSRLWPPGTTPRRKQGPFEARSELEAGLTGWSWYQPEADPCPPSSRPSALAAPSPQPLLRRREAVLAETGREDISPGGEARP
ncbi:unnamed protein product [Rangifer tarandus platyrhynchus]|uniref:Uncharacterized protein n=1 Tax=Rangifer tarandus platyrhynchus TaxID=3082113 RepID=A0AC60A0Z2_RANTA